MKIKYSKDLTYASKITIYVFVDGKKIGWICARKDFERGKIYFCYAYNSRKSENPKVLRAINAPTYIFENQEDLEKWITQNHKTK